MIFHIKAVQNMVAEHYMKTILTWFSTSRQLYENYFDMIFHLKATIWKLFWHDFPPQGNYMKTILTWFSTSKRLKTELQSTMKEIFTWFSTLRSLRKLVAEHYEGNFDMNFLFMAPRILIAEYYERDFEFLTWFSTWRQLKTSLQSAMK